jgi:hypothetical protein
MGQITTQAAEIFRLYTVEGDPTSVKWRPPKSDLVDLFTDIDTEIDGVRTIANAGVPPPTTPVRFRSTSTAAIATAFVNGTTHDGVTAATGDRFLMDGRSAPAENGVYIVPASGAPVRATDADSGAELYRINFIVLEGTLYEGTGWINSNVSAITLGVTSVTFVQNYANSGFSAILADVQADADAAAASAASAAAAATSIAEDAPEGRAFVVKGNGGAYPFAINDDGSAEFVEVYAPAIQRISTVGLRKLILTQANFLTHYEHDLSYGQSNSIGAHADTAGVVLSTTALYNSLMFNDGVRAYLTGIRTSLVPLVESYYAPDDLGETGMHAAAGMAGWLISRENDREPADLNWAIISSAFGEGGVAINGLLKGGSYYSRGTDDITAAKALAVAANKTYSVGALYWTQGETDDIGSTAIDWPNAPGTASNTYEFRFLDLKSDANIDYKALTGQTRDIPLIGFQVASHKQSGLTKPHTALAQRSLANTGHYNIAAPGYMFRYTYGHHFYPDEMQFMWLYYGLARKRILIDGKTWQHLDLASYSINRAVNPRLLTLTMTVPDGRLQTRTDRVSATTNHGFELFAADDSTGVTISSVTLGPGPNKITIATSADIPVGAQLWYARGATSTANTGRTAGPRGNICDSQGDWLWGYTPISGWKRMYNYLVMFKQTIA